MTQTPKETVTSPKSITNKISVTCWETIQILFAPWRIPRIALRCSMSYALFIFSFAVIWALFVIMCGLIGPVGEPYMDWKDYFSVNIVFVFIFFVIPVAVLFVSLRRLTSSDSNRADVRAILLSPTILIFPSLIWSFAYMVVQVRCPTFNFGIVKPEWIHWTIFNFLSESYLLVAGLIVLIVVGCVNAFCARMASKGKEGKMSKKAKSEEWEKYKEKMKLWDQLLPDVLDYPEKEYLCPFCSCNSLKYSWQLYSSEPRAASFDIYCHKCEEKAHFAVFLSEKARNSFRGE